MNDAAAVCIFERVANLLNNLEGAIRLKFSRFRCIQNVGKCFAVKPFHDNEEQIVITVEIYYPDNVRMDQAATLGRFLLQRTKCLAVFGEIWRQHLYRYPGFRGTRLIKPPVQRFVHNTHAAAAHPFLQHKAIAQYRSDLYPFVR